MRRAFGACELRQAPQQFRGISALFFAHGKSGDRPILVSGNRPKVKAHHGKWHQDHRDKGHDKAPVSPPHTGAGRDRLDRLFSRLGRRFCGRFGGLFLGGLFLGGLRCHLGGCRRLLFGSCSVGRSRIRGRRHNFGGWRFCSHSPPLPFWRGWCCRSTLLARLLRCRPACRMNRLCGGPCAFGHRYAFGLYGLVESLLDIPSPFTIMGRPLTSMRQHPDDPTCEPAFCTACGHPPGAHAHTSGPKARPAAGLWNQPQLCHR